MATITIGGNPYDSFATEAEADVILAADLRRAAPWAALTGDTPKQALVTASRYLAGLDWTDGVPDYTSPPEAVVEATALFAADIAAKPSLGDDASTGSNIKVVKADTAQVEFFRPVAGSPLPSYLLRLLSGLLGSTATWNDVGTAYGSSDWQCSRFDRHDYGLTEGYE